MNNSSFMEGYEKSNTNNYSSSFLDNVSDTRNLMRNKLNNQRTQSSNRSIAGDFQNIVADTRNIIGDTTNLIGDTITETATDIGRGVRNIVSDIGTDIERGVENIITDAEDVGTGIERGVGNIISDIRNLKWSDLYANDEVSNTLRNSMRGNWLRTSEKNLPTYNILLPPQQNIIRDFNQTNFIDYNSLVLLIVLLILLLLAKFFMKK